MRAPLRFLALVALAVAATAHATPPAAERPLYYERELTPQDLDGRTLRELNLMRNWIYARTGNVFRKKWLHDYFAEKEWYQATGVDVSKLSATDKKNADLIAKYELSLTKAELTNRLERLKAAHAESNIPGAWAAAFSADGERIALQLADGRNPLLVIDVQTGAKFEPKKGETFRPPLRVQEREVRSLDGTVTASADGRSLVVVRAGKKTILAESEAGPPAISGNGAIVAEASSSRNLRAWDAATGERLPKIPQMVEGPVFLSYDGSLGIGLFSDGYGFATRLFATREGRITADIGSLIRASAAVFSRNGQRVWIGSDSGEISEFDTATGKPVRQLRPGSSEEDSDAVTSLVLSEDGKRLLASTSRGPSFALFDAATGAQISVPGRDAWTQDHRIEFVLLSRAIGASVPQELMALVGDRSPLDDPHLLDELITVEQLKDLSRRDLRLLRNMVYARRGRVFVSASLNEFFGRMDWYQPDEKYTDKKLTKLDLKNIKVISSVEATLGGPLREGEMAPDIFEAA